MNQERRRIQVLLDVAYEPTQISSETLKRVLDEGLRHAIGSGLLTSDLDLEVETHDVHVNEVRRLRNREYVQALVERTSGLDPAPPVVVTVDSSDRGVLAALLHPGFPCGIRLVEHGGSRDPVGDEAAHLYACIDAGRFNLHIQGPSEVRSWSDTFTRRERPTPEYLGERLAHFERTFLADMSDWALAARQQPGQGRDQPRVTR